MELLKSITYFLLSSCMIFNTSNCLSTDITDSRRDYANSPNICFEKYINTLFTDVRNIIHICIIGSEMLTTNPESLNLLYGHHDDYWTVTSLNNVTHLQNLPKCTHIVWITPEFGQFDLNVLRKFNSDYLVAIHVIVQQPNLPTQSISNFDEKLRYLEDNIQSKIFIVNEIQCENSSSECQVFTPKMRTVREQESVEVNAISSELQKLNFQVVPVFVSERKRIFRVLAREYRPFYFQDKTEGVWKGIDHFLLQTIAQKLDLHVKISVLGEDKYLQQFHLKTFDLVIGGLARHLVNISSFGPLASYHQDDYTWCVARARLIPQWQNIFYIITDDRILVVTIINGIIANIIIFLITAFEPKPLGLWKVVSIYGYIALGMSGYFKPQHRSVRFFFAMLYIILLWIVTIFWAFILKFYSLQIYERQVKLETEIIERSYKLLASRTILGEIIQQKLIQSNALHLLEECLDIDACLRQTAASNHFAVAVSRQYAHSIIPNTQLFCFDRSENLFSDLMSFWIRKDSSMTHDINALIERVVEGGFVSKWVKDHKILWPEVNRPYSTIVTIENMFGGFLLVFFLTFVSIVVAISEKLIYRKAREPSAHRFWILASKFIDDERYLFCLHQNE